MSPARCDRCGSPLPASARFCPNCGAALDGVAREERRIVTLLFADVAASTKLAATLDAERLRDIMSAFFAQAERVFESLRGRAVSVAGDAVMAAFGFPRAEDDDALRAIRAGLQLRDGVEQLGRERGLPTPLRVRVGINTGPVAIGAGIIEPHHLAGVEVNLAARLQQAAEPGEILVSQNTWRLTRDAVAFGPGRAVWAKGFDSKIVVRPVEALSARSSRRTIPLVNRRRELTLFAGALERCRDTRRPHVVTVLGASGIGKSRLVQELLAGIPSDVLTVSARLSPDEEGGTFAPIRQMLTPLLDAEGGASGGERLRKALAIRGGAPTAGTGPPPSATERGGDAEEARAPAPMPRDVRRFLPAEIREGILEFLEAILEADDGRSAADASAPNDRARPRAAVMVLEDLHLAPAPLLDLVEALGRSPRRIPLVVLGAARRELLEARPTWFSGLPDAMTLALDELSPAEAVELARRAGEGLDDATARRIAERAGGNPFFIVEMTGLLQEDARSADADPELPLTVQAAVAARIDRLQPGAATLLRRVSIFPGGAFNEADLELIGGASAEQLAALQDAELIVAEPESPGAWRIRHSIVRDVAYEAATKRERRRLHLNVADALEAAGADRHPRAIAYHLEGAARASLDLAPADREIPDRAVEALAGAAELVRTGTDPRTAVDLYERALALCGPESSWGAREARLLAGLGEARFWLGEYPLARQPLERALELGDDLRVRADASRFLGEIALAVHGERDRAEACFDDALTAARALGDSGTLARTLLSAGWVWYWRDDLGRAAEVFREALDMTRSDGGEDPWAEGRALVALAVVTSSLGDERDCERMAREALAIAERIDDPFSIAVAQKAVSSSLRAMGRAKEAHDLLDASVATFRELGARWDLADALAARAVNRRQLGLLAEAEADARESIRLCLELEEQSLLTWAGGELAKILALGGDAAAARRQLEEIRATVCREGAHPNVGLGEAELFVLLAEGDEPRARALALEQLAADRERGVPNEVAAQVWRCARFFGADAVGGEAEAERARARLEEAHWHAYLDDAPVPSPRTRGTETPRASTA